MVGSMTKKVVWIFITLFPIFISITQFSDFWLMGCGNWKHILTVFSFHNSVFNGIFVIKITYGSHSQTFCTFQQTLSFLFFVFHGSGTHLSLYSPLLLLLFFLFFSLSKFGSSFFSSFLFYSPFLFFFVSFLFTLVARFGFWAWVFFFSLGFHSFFFFSSSSKLSSLLMLLLLLLSLWVVAMAAGFFFFFFFGFLEKKNTR